MKQIGMAILLLASLCSAQESGDSRPAATNVWGAEYEREREYVRVFIGQLRRKIEDDPLNPRFIVTEQGIGYRCI